MKILIKGYEWMKIYPQYRLSDDDIRKEKVGTPVATMAASVIPSYQQSQMNKNMRSKSSFTQPPPPPPFLRRNATPNQRRDRSVMQHSAQQRNMRMIECYRCENLGHIAKNCRTGQGQRQTQPRAPPPPPRPWLNINRPIHEVKCWLCGTAGHKINGCPYKRPPVSRCAVVVPDLNYMEQGEPIWPQETENQNKKKTSN